MTMRIGQGIDVHAFGPGDKIILGGTVIPYERGLIAYSDGDVLLHALSDALLGALSMGDIGHHFPDSDPNYKNINSRELLRLVYTKVNRQSFELVNADMTLVAQAPKMAPHIMAMRHNIARDLKTDIDRVSVKATTTEYLGFTGRKEGIAAFASVLLMQKDNAI